MENKTCLKPPTKYVCIYIYLYLCVCVPVQFYTLYIYKRFFTVSTHICTYSCMCFSLSLSLSFFFNPSPRLQEFSLRIPPQPPGLVDLFYPILPHQLVVFGHPLNFARFPRGFPSHGWPVVWVSPICPAVKVQGCCLCTLQFGLVIRDTLGQGGQGPMENQVLQWVPRHKVGPIVS